MLCLCPLFIPSFSSIRGVIAEYIMMSDFFSIADYQSFDAINNRVKMNHEEILQDGVECTIVRKLCKEKTCTNNVRNNYTTHDI